MPKKTYLLSNEDFTANKKIFDSKVFWRHFNQKIEVKIACPITGLKEVLEYLENKLKA